jgi:hypothetical protein
MIGDLQTNRAGAADFTLDSNVAESHGVIRQHSNQTTMDDATGLAVLPLRHSALSNASPCVHREQIGSHGAVSGKERRCGLKPDLGSQGLSVAPAAQCRPSHGSKGAVQTLPT